MFQIQPYFYEVWYSDKENTLILNILFGIDVLVPNLGPTMEVLSDFMKFGTRNKWNIRIDIHC